MPGTYRPSSICTLPAGCDGATSVLKRQRRVGISTSRGSLILGMLSAVFIYRVAFESPEPPLEVAFAGSPLRPVRTSDPLSSVTALRARKFFVGGNWKANGNPSSIQELVSSLNEQRLEVDAHRDVEVVCAPPHVFLAEVQSRLREDYAVAAQDLWDKKPGAWTGETPAKMLVDMGIQWAIIGHSERRENCGETSDVVAEKTRFAIDEGMSTITCIGEKLQEREAGVTNDVLDKQLRPIAAALSNDEASWGSVVLAYEPVWAIGTGLVATPAQAEETHSFIRRWLAENVSPTVSEKVRILYGGSVNDKNSEELAGMPNIDGFLVGGASLKGGAFTAIVNSAKASGSS